MKQAFRVNRIKIAEINAQIEDNLSGIRVVKSFANEDLEIKNLKWETMLSLKQKRTTISIWVDTTQDLQLLQQ